MYIANTFVILSEKAARKWIECQSENCWNSFASSDCPVFIIRKTLQFIKINADLKRRVSDEIVSVY